MGRSALIVKKDALQAVVNELEAAGEFDNLTALCTAVANSEWGKSVKNSRMQPRPISPAKVYTSIRDLHISFKTKAGKRGRAKGQKVNRTSRKDKLAGNEQITRWKDTMYKVVGLPEVPDRYRNVVDKVSEGSFRAGVALACANCHGFEGTKYKSCCSTTCPLLPLNLLMWPNRGKDEINEAGFGFDESELNILSQ